MKALVKARDVLLLLSLAASAGCSNDGPGNRGPAGAIAQESARPAVSAEQMRAAQLLSLSGGAPATKRSDYAGSVECAATLGLFMNGIENSPLIDDAQLDALRQAQKLFRARALEAGAAEGNTPGQVNVALERATEDARDDSAKSSRTAIDCVRGLAAEAQRSAGLPTG